MLPYYFGETVCNAPQIDDVQTVILKEMPSTKNTTCPVEGTK